MDKEQTRLSQLLAINDQEEVFSEIKHIVSQLADDFDYDFLEQVYKDIQMLFQGKYPGYRECNTKYHTLEHTISVTLATARLVHGGYIEGYKFDAKNMILTMAAALFHDTGLIQTDEDLEGSGAKYTVGHEERSIEFMGKYLSKAGFSSKDLDDCSHFIMCTMLNMPTEVIPFSSEETETLGKIVGSADLLAQMADRYYLEKLLLLYKEFEEANLPGFESELRLIQKTVEFYENVSKKRLSKELGGVSSFMRIHFRDRWSLDRDLYDESISKNIEYLKSLIVLCEDSFTCYLENLKRGGISKEILASLKIRKTQ